MPRKPPRSRGMTLVELMVVVAIIGVVAILATVGYARYTRTARTAEATDMIAAIKGAQEAYFSHTGRYLDLSNGLTPGNLYPKQTPDATTTAWGSPCSWCKAEWTRLGVNASAPVWFAYATVADGDVCDPDCRGVVFSINGTNLNWTSMNGSLIKKPWYIVSAYADTNGNGVFAKVVGTSFSTILLTEKEGE